MAQYPAPATGSQVTLARSHTGAVAASLALWWDDKPTYLLPINGL